MVKVFAALSLGAVIILSPLAAMAQSDEPAQPTQVAQAESAHAAGGGSFRRHMRHRGNLAGQRARASAEHMRRMHPRVF